MQEALDAKAPWPCAAVLICVVGVVDWFVYCSVVYWMAGLNPVAGDFFYYMVLALTVDTALSSFFRMCVFIAPSVVLAEVWCACVLFHGTLVPSCCPEHCSSLSLAGCAVVVIV